MGDQSLQPDMHLKPLDNDALLKPLRKPADAPPTPAVPPPAPPPAAPKDAPKESLFKRLIPKDDEEDDLFSLPKTATVPPVDPPDAQAEAAEDGELVPPEPESELVPEPEPEPELEPEPVAFVPTEPDAEPEAPLEDAFEPEALVEAAIEPKEEAQPEADMDEDDLPAPQPEPEAENTPKEEPDEALPPETDPAKPASKHPTSYKPTDEQVHMMELMKSIFASALNAGVSSGQPPQVPAPQPKASMGDLREDLMALQQQIRALKIPVVIVIEGLSASGKGAMLGKLIEGLDSRAYQTHPVRRPNCVEESYPTMWRYWTQMPKRGHIALFCSSWYGELNKTCMAHEDDVPEILPQRLNEIISMESQLICDGTLILKFFLHVSQQEQYNRLKKMEKKKSTAWHVVEQDHEQNKRYDEYMKGMDNLMSITNLKGAPWHILDATDLKACKRSIYETVIRSFKDVIHERKTGLRPWDVPMLPNLSPITSQGFPPLRTIDLHKELEAPYKDELKALTKKLKKLQEKLYRKDIPLAIAFEGWDAAGKGGAIYRLIKGLDARGFTVTAISAPTPLEDSHHYMWRFYHALPPKGHIAIFDRTWYGRVMVERIEGFCTQPQWQRAYEEINRFEKQWTDSGAILCKFWLQIDEEEQLTRFDDRAADPEKQWKLTDEDWRNRDKWPQYEQAVDEVLQRTHTAHAPWTVVEANNKKYARIKVLRTVINAIEKRLQQDDDKKD